MMIYRYEFEDGEGIIRGIDKLSDCKDDLDNYCWDLVNIFDRDLPPPDYDLREMMSNKSIKTKSYFTEHGNTKFKETIDLILDLAKSKGVNVRCICISDSILSENEVVYRDMFQVIYKVN